MGNPCGTVFTLRDLFKNEITLEMWEEAPKLSFLPVSGVTAGRNYSGKQVFLNEQIGNWRSFETVTKVKSCSPRLDWSYSVPSGSGHRTQPWLEKPQTEPGPVTIQQVGNRSVDLSLPLLALSVLAGWLWPTHAIDKMVSCAQWAPGPCALNTWIIVQ